MLYLNGVTSYSLFLLLYHIPLVVIVNITVPLFVCNYVEKAFYNLCKISS